MTEQNGEAKQWAEAVAKVWADDDYKQWVMDDPATLLPEEGIEMPACVDIRVVETTDN